MCSGFAIKLPDAFASTAGDHMWPPIKAYVRALCPRSCINVLLELIQTKVNYVVQESIIVIKDIFRWAGGQVGAT